MDRVILASLLTLGFAVVFVVSLIVILRRKRQWFYGGGWSLFVVAALAAPVALAAFLLTHLRPSAATATPVVVSAPADDAPDDVDAQTWQYRDEPQHDGRVGRSACVDSLDDAGHPENDAELCVSRLDGVGDAWLHLDNEKFAWGKDPQILLSFDGQGADDWSNGPPETSEPGVRYLAGPDEVQAVLAGSQKLLIEVIVKKGATPLRLRFNTAGLDLKKIGLLRMQDLQRAQRIPQ